MARLHEYQGKAILAANGFKIPPGRSARTAEEAAAAAAELGGEVVIKIQAWTTGRAGIGGVAFAKKADEIRAHAERMLAMKVGQFPVEAVLVEEKIDIVTAKRLFVRWQTHAISPLRRRPGDSLVTLATCP
jgi:succinyl-CoA synthetase beta subunit